MIIFDTETTGLLKASIVDLDKQPKIIEFAAIKICDVKLEEVGRLQFLVNPNESLSKEIIKITGLNDNDLKDEKTFEYYYPALVEFFLGERTIFAHNISFDIGMLKNELARIGRMTQFPYPPRQICTVNQTFQIKGYRLSLGKLYQHCFGKEMKEAHRAMPDVENLAKCVIYLLKNEQLKLS